MRRHLHVIHMSTPLATSPINSDSRVHLAPHPGSHELSSNFFSNFFRGPLKGCHSILIQYTIGLGETEACQDLKQM